MSAATEPTYITIPLDAEVDALLEAVATEQGHTREEVAVHVLRRFVRTERLRRALQDPGLAALYQELAAEDLALADEGLSEYQELLDAADQP